MPFAVVLYAPFAAPFLCDPPQPGAGGAELQMTLLGRALAGAGLRVGQVVYPHPLLPATSQGVAVIQRPESLLGGVPGRVREARAIWSVLHRTGDAPIVHRSAGAEVAITAAYART